ncbi:hypothetical protein M231_01426 [Tremella mesenterica]|uniref:Fungal lipase-type domain-containing protein n=1 Tax=Tremella mesenterica TaxID=5217 RepID=A0A4Q1BTD8_TREME|nr:uncharacterized protein TREMEDRAFT_65211 [Tremella mesenterica DSM 1558]EIW66807.1 hypothetical protein TREMEDRAFT_65211 [Tremella mesenterica DSM 1558]RXK41276.1 hypothetical protein M231_01426 [Tremella mesenterica]
MFPVILLTLGLSVAGMPANNFISILTDSTNSAQTIPVGKTPVSRADMMEIARLATIASNAYCPQDRQLQPPRKGENLQRVAKTGSVVASSREREPYEDELPISWYISHNPSSQTLTLALSSLPSLDQTLELLSSSPTHNLTHGLSSNLVDLPSWLFPPEVLPFLPPPSIHHSYIPALETRGTDALVSLLGYLENPLPPFQSGTDILRSVLTSWSTRHSSASKSQIKHVDVVGHGIGAALGLLIALALHLEVSGPAAASYITPLPEIDITATLFGLPRVGDTVFADWVEDLVEETHGKLKIHKITSYADTVVHLPERHMGLVHPPVGEIWVGADPRVAYACRGEGKDRVCSEEMELSKTSLLDHAGPFAGVWIGPGSCRRPELAAHMGF